MSPAVTDPANARYHGAPGHSRKNPPPQCVAKTRKGVQCSKYDLTNGSYKSKNPLCRFHRVQAEMLASGAQVAKGQRPTRQGSVPTHIDDEGNEVPIQPPGGPDSDPSAIQRGAVTRTTKQLHAALVNEQARQALAKLRLEPNSGFDPKQALLWTVESAYRQQRIWEAMLAAIPEEDYDRLGEVPIPGQRWSAKGARIEVITRHLSIATATAAKVAKAAVDAGIEERVVRLAEEQSALIADTVKAAAIAVVATVATMLHLSPSQQIEAQEAALSAAANQLRLLAAGGEEVVDGVAVRMSKGEPANA